MSKIDVSELGLEVTRFCTLECIHCLRGNRKKEFISSEVIEVAFKNINCVEKLLITGGEPLLAINAIKKIIYEIRKNNVRIEKITIITNATILHNKQIELLDELKLLCNEFNILISFDKFHLMEIENKEYLEENKRILEILKERYNAKLYGYPYETEWNVMVQPIGRAANITQEYLDKINATGEPSRYVLFPKLINHCYYKKDDYLSGGIYISVNGMLVTDGIPFDEEDAQDEKFNILRNGFLESINNRINDSDFQNCYKKLLEKTKNNK